jgi:hypothetical protein
MNPRDLKLNANKKIYTISGRTMDEVMNSTINKLIDHYQINNVYMEDYEKVEYLENIVDLIKIKEYL